MDREKIFLDWDGFRKLTDVKSGATHIEVPMWTIMHYEGEVPLELTLRFEYRGYDEINAIKVFRCVEIFGSKRDCAEESADNTSYTN